MGAIASLLVLMSFSPPPTSLAGYALMREAMAEIATWIFFPSFVLTLIAGLLAIAANRAYHDAGWAWVKLATGILVFAGSLHALGPIQEEAKRSAGEVAGRSDPARRIRGCHHCCDNPCRKSEPPFAVPDSFRSVATCKAANWAEGKSRN